jgi:hypothetical protein
MTKIASYKSKTPVFAKLPTGANKVRLVSFRPTDSFHNYDGTLKETLPDYTNPCEQLAITVVSTEGKGGLTHRLNLEGYVPFSKLSAAEIESGKFTDVSGYACAVNPKSKELNRIPDPANTAVCEGIMDQLFAALGMAEGSGIEDLDAIIAEKKEFIVNVTNEPYEGKDQLRISQFKKAAVAVVETSDIDG